MITYEQIQKANEGLSGIDVKGKSYVMVPERVKAFRMLYPEGFIHTDLISLENGVCVMQSKAGYYNQNGQEVILGSGMAYEKEANGYINKTSYIENCETSAVGRALGFLGLGIDGGGICSAEELANAINNQNKNEKKGNEQVQAYLKVSSKLLMEKFGITDEEEMKKRMVSWKKSLINGGVIKNIKFEDMTLEQAEKFIEAIYANFDTEGSYT